MILTPNLTPMQHARLLEALSRMTGLSCAPMLYADADRLAGRWMLEPHKEHQRASDTADTLADAYGTTPVLAAYVAGLALGVRLGRHFARAPRQPRKTLSDEYAALDADQRRDVAKLIRALASGEHVFRLLSYEPTSEATTEEDIAAARRWTKQAGQTARARR